MELHPHWSEIKHDYKILQVIGHGTFGQVVKAKIRQTGEYVAIKLISNCFQNESIARQICREIMLMRRLSKLQRNFFTTQLIDVILPPGVNRGSGEESLEKT